MAIARESMEESDDAAPVEMLAQLFDAHGWPCEFIGDDEVCGEIRGSWAAYQVRGIWRREDQVLQLLCLPEVHVPESKLKPAYELLSLINEQVWLGHFDIWSQGSVLLYRHGMMLGDGVLSLNMAQMAVDNAVSECDRFYPAFQFVIWGDKEPQDALAASMIDAAGEA